MNLKQQIPTGESAEKALKERERKEYTKQKGKVGG